MVVGKYITKKGVKNLIKRGITTDCVAMYVVLNVSRYLLAALFYSMYVLNGTLKEAGRYDFTTQYD